MARELTDVFPLNVVAPALASFRPPRGDFEPSGEWTHRYALYTIGQRSISRAGSLMVQRKARAEGAVLSVDYRKLFPGRHTGRVVGEVHCRGDALSTPTRWRASFEILRPDGEIVPNTRLEKTGEVKGKGIAIRDAATARTIPTPAAFTIHWALFDAVQRLPRQASEPKRFTLLDDFDEVKPNHTLSFRKTVEVMLGGKRVRKQRWEQLDKGRIRKTTWGREGDRPVRLHAFDHLGDGIVPEVYWVDDQGRLLFMVAGIEAWLWEAAE